MPTSLQSKSLKKREKLQRIIENKRTTTNVLIDAVSPDSILSPKPGINNESEIELPK